MNVSLYQAASALNAMDRWQETIAENLASSPVSGFKKQDFSFAAVQAGLRPVPVSTAAGASRNVRMARLSGGCFTADNPNAGATPSTASR